MFKVMHLPLSIPLIPSSKFGIRQHKTYWWHNGIDYTCKIATPIYAIADGIVKNTKDGGSYGLYVDIWHYSNAGSLYSHMSNFVVSPGEEVKAGQLIGYSGNTGDTTGPHLHFEIRLCRTYDEFWERCEKDSNVFMRCVDPEIFVEDYLTRLSIGVKAAQDIVQRATGIDDNTMAFLSYYKYDKELIVKLAGAML